MFSTMCTFDAEMSSRSHLFLPRSIIHWSDSLSWQLVVGSDSQTKGEPNSLTNNFHCTVTIHIQDCVK